MDNCEVKDLFIWVSVGGEKVILAWADVFCRCVEEKGEFVEWEGISVYI